VLPCLPLFDIIKGLHGWKSKNIYTSGCLVLIKFVLSLFSIYFLSFFKAPMGMISFIGSPLKKYWGMRMFIRFIGRSGIRCVLLGSLEVLGFEELGNLIWCCQGSVVRGYMLIRVCSSSKCWMLNTGYKGVVFRGAGNYVSAWRKDLCQVREVV